MGAILSVDGTLTLTHGGTSKAFLNVKAFELEKPGVYTLEGPNGSGKSMFIRFLTGTLPGAIEHDSGCSLRVNGRPTKVGSYRDALRQGLTSVFQDDEMVSSISVFDNILLRHGHSNLSNLAHYAWDMSANLVGPPLNAIGRTFGPALPIAAQSLLERLEPRKIDWAGRRVLRERATRLLHEHGVPEGILDQMPARLSGGGRAAAKIVSAQLYSQTKVLLLDEAFNGVERNIWPRFLDTIKAWAADQGAVVLAITHSGEELQRWDPLVRFDIQDGNFVVAEEFLYGIRRRTIMPRQTAVPIFEISASDQTLQDTAYRSLWARFKPVSQVIVLSDAASQTSAAAQVLKDCQPFGARFTELVLSSFDLQSIDSVVARLESISPLRRAVIVIVGSSLTRSLACFASTLTQHLDSAGVVVLPVSFTDAVEAVITSTVSATLGQPSVSTQPVVLSTIFNPDAFIMPMDSLQSMSSGEAKLALIPCLRLGLLFGVELFNACVRTLSTANVHPDAAISLFRQSVRVMNDVTELGLQSSGIGRVANFGSIHAMAVSRVTKGRLGTGESLLIGMIIEALVAKTGEVLDSLINVATQLGIRCPRELCDHSSWVVVEEVYKQKGEVDGGETFLSNVGIPSIGHFSVAQLRERLASVGGSQNRNLLAFANAQADGSIRRYPLLEVQMAIMQLGRRLPAQ